MKIIFFLFIALSFLLSGCQKEPDILVDDSASEEVEEIIEDDNKPNEIIREYTIEPKLYLPKIVSIANLTETSCSLSIPLNAFFFTRIDEDQNNGLSSIWVTTYFEGEWSTSVPLISMGDADNYNPYVTPDGQYMLFSRRYVTETDTQRSGTYYMQRTESGWTEAVYLTDIPWVTTTDFQTFYGAPEQGTHQNELVQFQYVNGTVQNMFPLMGAVNTTSMESRPMIAPDGAYILFDSDREGSIDGQDMYISYRQSDGTWSAAIALNASVNTGLNKLPSISSDGEHFFYTSRGDIYYMPLKWVLPEQPE